MACQVGGKTVEGFLYETRVEGIGAQAYDTWEIFVPSKHLILSEKKNFAFVSPHKMTSKKARELFNQLWDEGCSDDERGKRIQKADEEAQRVVQVPAIIVDEIYEALKSNPAAWGSSKDKYVNERVNEIFKQVWACNKSLDG